MLAVHTDEISFPTVELSGERKMTSSANYQYEDFQRTLDLAFAGKLKLDDLVTHRVPLSNVDDGFDLLRNKEESGAMKIVVIPQAHRA